MKKKDYYQQLKVVAKFSLLGFLTFLIALNFVLASETNTQYRSVKEVYLSIGFENTELRQVFEKVESATDYHFTIYENNKVLSERVTIPKQMMSVEQILMKISAQKNVRFQQVNNNIGVRKVTKRSKEVVEVIIANKDITGKVTDEKGEGLPGASILEKGTANGTITDIDGNFSLTVGDDATLVISFVGFESVEVSVASRTNFNIELAADISALEEVVVVGYGTQKRADITGSVVSLSTEKTSDLPNYSVLQSIQGRVPGVNISTPALVGRDPQLRVRGENSISASNSPLIVVDGIIYFGNISDFNPNDIESIDILKDASAAAVYGARAANGVILITTKTGKTSKPTFNFEMYTGLQQPAALVDVMDGPRYLEKIDDYNQILLDGNPNASLIELTAAEQENFDNNREIDWIDRSLREGVIQSYNLNFSGASEATDYYISGTYFDQQGIVKGDDFQRVTVNLNLNTSITDWYTIGVRSSFSSRDYSGQEANLEQATMQSPYGSFNDPDGPGGYAFNPVGDQLGSHPLIPTLEENEEVNTTFRGMLSSNLEVPFIEGLKWTLNFSTTYRNVRFYNFENNQVTNNGMNQNGIAIKNVTVLRDLVFDNILNYRRTFGKHNIDITALLSRENNRADSTGTRGVDFVSQDLGFNNLGLSAVQTAGSNFEVQNSLSQMGRFNYGYDNRYAATFTVRRDGFSAFAKNNKYATFWAGALAWTFTNEPFFDVGFINHLKLRASYGQNGNRGIDRYSSLSRIGTNKYLFGNSGGSIATYGIAALGNEALTWEVSLTTNIGIDYEILDSRIYGSIDAYLTNTSDLLQSRALPNLTGFSSVLTNIGEVQNKGIEVAINSINVSKGDFNWESNFVFALNRNKIVTLGGLDADGDGIEDDDISNGWFIGHPIDAIFGFETDGIYQEEDEIPAGFRAGDFRLVDEDGDGTISTDDRKILGAETPNFTMNLGNTVRYNNWSLYVLLTSVQGGGNNFYLGNNYETRSVNRIGFGTFSERFNLQDIPYWTPSNSTNKYPRLDYTPAYNHPILEDRSFVRIQDISLAYNFDQSLLDNIGINNLKVYISIKNLHTFTKWSGYDPENATTIRDFPFLKAYTAGLNFSF